MNILILNGSPRQHGNTVKILKQIQEGIAGRHSVEWVDVAGLAVRPCTGCLRCRPDQECVLPEDDAQRIGRKITAADALIIGSPTYWGNMTGPLKNLFDRSVTVFEVIPAGQFPRPRHKGKKAIIVTTSGAPWPFNQLASQSKGTIRALKTVLHSAGYRISDVINYGGAALPREVPPQVLNKAKRLGGSL